MCQLGDLGHAIRADGSMRVEEGDERYLSMDVLRSIDLFNISKVHQTQTAPPALMWQEQGLARPVAAADTALICLSVCLSVRAMLLLSQGQEVPDYHGILAPNDIFGLGASLYVPYYDTPSQSLRDMPPALTEPPIPHADGHAGTSWRTASAWRRLAPTSTTCERDSSDR